MFLNQEKSRHQPQYFPRAFGWLSVSQKYLLNFRKPLGFQELMSVIPLFPMDAGKRWFYCTHNPLESRRLLQLLFGVQTYPSTKARIRLLFWPQLDVFKSGNPSHDKDLASQIQSPYFDAEEKI
ncbi:hypothetical protein M413DRAFT_207065 [Hebeloma cylindrosporum]|uniref:Uncharacterized protein n=1 Tax=Hebeloma cylindrosporum TaxID=76867 RepID=A0A0C3CG20_HEBCY|nr:hypothetical protein M413DRAFT_207065 [Hebeloma cylindrosporum h7]